MDLWVFDNDGTLYDDSMVGSAFMKALYPYLSARLKIKLEEAADFCEALKRKWNTSFTVVALLREYELTLDDLVQNTYMKLDLTSLGVPIQDPERSEALRRIKSPKIVLTNNPAEFARKVLDHIGLSWHFAEIIGMKETGLYAKPSPLVYICIQARYPGSSRIIFCDDRLENLVAAKKFGWITIWYDPRQTGPNDSADFVISSFSELASVQDKLPAA